MEDLFKKFINAGVGFVSLTSDRVQSTIDALVRESKLSEEEGKKIMDDLKKNSDTKRKELEKQFSTIASKLMKSVGVASNADVEELKRSVKGGSKSGSTGTASSTASASKSGGSKSAAKPASSATAKAAGATKKAADSVSSAAGSAQKSAAAKAGASKSSGSKSGGAKKETPAAPAGGTDTAQA